MDFDGIFEINGAPLFCKIRGEGKPILLLHGAAVDADFFDEAAEILANNHKVITYDRRGYFRSGGKTETGFWEDSSEDAAEIIRKFSPDSPVAVIGCSAGALIGMQLANMFPRLISLLILHEPPIMEYWQPDGETWGHIQTIHRFIQEGRPGRGKNKFLLLMGPSDEQAKVMPEEKLEQMDRNLQFFLQNEFDEVFLLDHVPDIPSDVKTVVCAGDAHRNDPLYKAAQLLSARKKIPFARIPGMHNSPRDLPLDFASAMIGLIQIYLE